MINTFFFMKKFPRFWRQFNKAITDFQMLNSDDKILIPIDADFSHLSLISCILKKSLNMSPNIPLNVIHFFDQENPQKNTIDYLNSFCSNKNLTLQTKKATFQQKSQTDYKKLLLDTAIEYNCNKIALPDSLDFFDASIISNMAFQGFFDGPSAVETISFPDGSTQITFIRPFCYITDEEINKFGTISDFLNNSTGIQIEEDELTKFSREGISLLLDDQSNIRMNLFNSQFNVQKKYIGGGSEQEIE